MTNIDYFNMYSSIADSASHSCNVFPINPYKVHISNEIWRTVKDFPNYLVSNYGKVKSIARTFIRIRNSVEYKIPVRERLLKPSPGIAGHLQVTLTNDTKQFHEYVHRLVAVAYVPNSENYPHVMHCDDDPSNNRSTNLEWGTPEINNLDRDLRGRTAKGSKQGSAKLTEKDIPKIRRLIQQGIRYKDIGVVFGVHLSVIGYIATGRSWRHVKKSN